MEKLVKIECISIAASREVLDRIRGRVAYDLIGNTLYVYGHIQDGIGERCDDPSMLMRLRRVYLDSRNIELFMIAIRAIEKRTL